MDECAHDGNENEGDRSVSSLAHAAKEGAQMDMRSEMDTMSIGSASEMASDDAETCAARFQSVSTKRDRVASMVAELEREERDVGSSEHARDLTDELHHGVQSRWIVFQLE